MNREQEGEDDVEEVRRKGLRREGNTIRVWL